TAAISSSRRMRALRRTSCIGAGDRVGDAMARAPGDRSISQTTLPTGRPQPEARLLMNKLFCRLEPVRLLLCGTLELRRLQRSVKQFAGKVLLRHVRQLLLDAVATDERYVVRRSAETTARASRVVGDDPVQ